MDLKLSNNLFLGLTELTQLKQALKTEGYEKLIKQMVTSYGIVKPSNTNQFTALQLISSGAGQLTVRSGVAIDKNLNIIDVQSDQVDALTVEPDSVLRYVTIKYRKTIIEQGTIDVQEDGTIVGVGTNFTERLRGQSNFPSKIVIVENDYDPNTDSPIEYEIQAVQNDTLASLNTAQGTVQATTNKKYAIVGSFTPGILVPENDKYPLESDGYEIQLKLTDALIEDEEFIIGSVSYDGTALTITDRRLENIFSILDVELDIITDSNSLVGIESIKYDKINSTRSNNLVKIGWGLKSLNNNWSINQALQELTITQASGGVWDDISQFSANDLDGWRVIFEQTGDIVKIDSSSIGAGTINLLLDFDSYPTEGNIYVVPNADFIEFKISSTTNPTVNRELSFSVKQGFAIIPIQAGIISNIQYRHIKGDSTNTFRNIQSGDYVNEQSFNDNGTQSSISLTTYTDGNIQPLLNSDVNLSLLNLVLPPRFIMEFFGTIAQAEAQQGWVVCDGRTINDPTSTLNGLVTPDYRQRVSVGVDVSDSDYDQAGNTGGTSSVVLNEDQMPVHSHGVDDPGHEHATKAREGTNLGDSTVAAGGGAPNDDTLRILNSLSGNADTESSETGITIEQTGGNEPVDIRQKYITMFKLMKL